MAENEWDVELKIYGKQDRETVMMILARNGYDVGQHKKARKGSTKSVDYFVHARLNPDNTDAGK